MGGYWPLYGLIAVALVGAILPLWRLGRRRRHGELVPIRRVRDRWDDEPGGNVDDRSVDRP